MPLGVDEAGKGPVLGSMFAAAVWVPTRDRLPDGVTDSKRLTPDRRAALAAQLRADDTVEIGVAEITPREIDDPDTDMNELAVEAHARALEAAADAVDGVRSSVHVRCDACDTDADRFARRVAEACEFEVAFDSAAEAETDVEIEAQHGADDDDPLVGAASIIAKVERDAHVERLATEYAGDRRLEGHKTNGNGVGSGYPSDPTTRAFLEAYVAEHGDLPACARRSWSTCDDVLAAAEQTSLDGF